MRTETRCKSSSGQAAVEFAIGVFLLAFILTFILEFGPVLLYNLKMQGDARTDAGIAALGTSLPGPTGVDAGEFPSSLPACDMIPGFAVKPFRFTLSLGGEPLVSEEGKIREEIFLPAVGGFPVQRTFVGEGVQP